MARTLAFAPSLEGSNRVRDQRIADSHQKDCQDCGQPFTVVNVRQRFCEECRTRSFRFVGVDSEGMELDCRECGCEMFSPSGYDPDWCECGHTKISFTGDLSSGHVHKAVLLGIGDEHITSPDGLEWEDCFEFIYSQFDPKTTYVGFFLSYDYIMWSKTTPWNKARQLWEKPGIDSRRYKNAAGIPKYHAVKIEGRRLARDVKIPIVQRHIADGIIPGDKNLVWEVHLHADRRLQLRPMICGCPGDHHLKMADRAKHPTARYMYINDVGGFFQTSFLSVIDPSKWEQPIVTPEEYALIEEGKRSRATAVLGPEMIEYNRKEVELLARVMTEYATGLAEEGITLSRLSWYGPGQAAQAWLRNEGTARRTDIASVVPDDFLNLARMSYFGGWFEIMMHGHILGITYEYDINSAYPFIIASLPCLLHGKYTSHKPESACIGLPEIPAGAIQLVKASVYGSNPHIGAMLHRGLDNSILRPTSTRGVFWRHELEAARNAGLIDRVECSEWKTYEPCDCFPPLRRVANLYLKRLSVGKNSPHGKALKTVYNSMYGKFAQSIGEPAYANQIYASLITAGCRTMILNAIATHPGPACDKCKTRGLPGGPCQTAMVATDGVYFLTPHTGLALGKALGEWEEAQKANLTLFKPGVYWDDNARRAIEEGKSPTFKARGVNARDFATVIPQIDHAFSQWGNELPSRRSQWPSHTFKLGFSMVTAKQALTRGSAALIGKAEPKPEQLLKAKDRWELAGLVSEVRMTHSSWPGDKRMTVNYNGQDHAACSMRELGEFDGTVYRSKPHELTPNRTGEPQISKPYNKAFGSTAMYENGSMDAEEYGITPDGLVRDHWYEAMQIRNA